MNVIKKMLLVKTLEIVIHVFSQIVMISNKNKIDRNLTITLYKFREVRILTKVEQITRIIFSRVSSQFVYFSLTFP